MKIHMVPKGVSKKSTLIHKGGGGGQKYPKNHPHGLRMTPNGIMIFNIFDNTTELYMTKYIIGEIFNSGRATLYTLY